ncbi:hypothetical protein BDR07DRAFT_1408073, partial [Suillus spraguei]
MINSESHRRSKTRNSKTTKSGQRERRLMKRKTYERTGISAFIFSPPASAASLNFASTSASHSPSTSGSVLGSEWGVGRCCAERTFHPPEDTAPRRLRPGSSSSVVYPLARFFSCKGTDCLCVPLIALTGMLSVRCNRAALALLLPPTFTSVVPRRSTRFIFFFCSGRT